MIRIIIIVFCCVLQGYCQNKVTEAEALSYLDKYGYMKASNSTAEDMSPALRMLQKTYNIEVTGNLNEETQHLMARPRCSNPDVMIERPRKWTNLARENRLTYNFVNFSTARALPADKTEQVLKRAFRKWTSKIDFAVEREMNSDTEIKISFFDTTDERLLGSAYLPNNGYIAFAQNQPVIIKTEAEQNIVAYDFNWIALHEVGHSLGLVHSDDSNSIMHGIYVDDVKDLSAEDVQRIEELYFVDKAHLCSLQIEDSVLYKDANGDYIFMLGRQYWLVSATGMRKGPFEIHRELPNNIDEAFSINRSTFFFDGVFFYKYTNGISQGPKRLIEASFPKSLVNIDAAFVYQEKFYAFKGHQFFTYDVKKMMQEKRNVSPNLIAEYFPGIQDNITTATVFGSKVMFIHGRYFSMFDMEKKITDPNMPKDLNLNYFRCYFE